MCGQPRSQLTAICGAGLLLWICYSLLSFTEMVHQQHPLGWKGLLPWKPLLQQCSCSVVQEDSWGDNYWGHWSALVHWTGIDLWHSSHRTLGAVRLLNAVNSDIHKWTRIEHFEHLLVTALHFVYCTTHLLHHTSSVMDCIAHNTLHSGTVAECGPCVVFL